MPLRGGVGGVNIFGGDGARTLITSRLSSKYVFN